MSHQMPEQPKLGDLMARYLGQQAKAHEAGLGSLDLTDEVSPFEAGPVQPVDSRPAWTEAIAVVPFLRAQADTACWQAPPEWAQLVAAQEPIVALAFCVGNYPQLMRDLHRVLHHAKLTDLQPRAGRPIDVPALVDWARHAAGKKQFPQMLLAAGALRLARHFDAAHDYLTGNERSVPADWRAAWANERAALAWHRGRAAEALGDWEKQEPTVPVLFNRGMAALFLGQPAQAKGPLAEAVAQLPEAGPWHHLGQLYLALAQTI